MAFSVDEVLGLASLASGLPGLIEVCLHFGDFVVSRLGAYQKWDISIADYALKVSVHWDIQKYGLQKLQKLGDDLEIEVKARLVQVLLRLKQLLEEAGTVLSRHTPAQAVKQSALSSSLKRLKFSLFEDKALANLDQRIGEWETLFSKRLVLVIESTPNLFPTTEIEQIGGKVRPRPITDSKYRHVDGNGPNTPSLLKRLQMLENQVPSTVTPHTWKLVQVSERYQDVVQLTPDMAPEIRDNLVLTDKSAGMLSNFGYKGLGQSGTKAGFTSCTPNLQQNSVRNDIIEPQKTRRRRRGRR